MSEEKKINRKEIKSTLIGLINGSILTSAFIKKQIWFISLIFLLAVIYISNIYNAEKVFRETEKTIKEIDELRAEKIELEHILIQKSRIAEVERLLKNEGSTLKKSKTPPQKIPYYENNERQ
jgi:archaellum component FlaF (FlaF/FlaG flagellin family)